MNPFMSMTAAAVLALAVLSVTTIKCDAFAFSQLGCGKTTTTAASSTTELRARGSGSGKSITGAGAGAAFLAGMGLAARVALADPSSLHPDQQQSTFPSPYSSETSTLLLSRGGGMDMSLPSYSDATKNRALDIEDELAAVNKGRIDKAAAARSVIDTSEAKSAYNALKREEAEEAAKLKSAANKAQAETKEKADKEAKELARAGRKIF